MRISHSRGVAIFHLSFDICHLVSKVVSAIGVLRGSGFVLFRIVPNA